MQLKNNETRTRQFFYNDPKHKDVVSVVHIPAGATVELDDAIFKQLLASKTTINIMREVVAPIESETQVKMEKKDVLIKEYFDTGETKTVNLVQVDIDAGLLIVVERPKVTEAEMNQVLTDNGFPVKDVPIEKRQEVYNKLVG